MTRWAAIRDWLGLDGAESRHPRHVELIILRTGKAAFSLRFNLYYLHWALTAFGTMLALWLITLGWAAWYHAVNSQALDHADVVEQQMKVLQADNSALNHSRSVLATRYQKMLDQLGLLENQVRKLADRYHEPAAVGGRSQPGARAAMGGVAWPVSREAAFAAMQQQMQSRIGELSVALAQLQARPEGWPITRAADITSRFGVRANPFGEDSYEFHKGLDFAAPYASPVWSTAPGTVITAGLTGPNGNLVVVDHGYGYRTAYAHLSQIRVHVGDTVQAGQVIGLSGNTGRSTGPHLHYAVYLNGVLIDPYPYVE